MKRTICIKGIGTVKAKPDYVTIAFSTEAVDKDYAKSVDKANAVLIELGNALAGVGFDKTELKTKNFSVSVKNKSVRDKDGNYKSVFEGYSCRHDLSVSFDFDRNRLADVIGAIAGSNAHPQLDIRFTVKDKSAVAEGLLERAVHDAKAKAATLARASGVRLGELVSIDYNWAELDIASPTRYNDCTMLRAAAPVEFEPDDITASDTVTVTWEIDG